MNVSIRKANLDDVNLISALAGVTFYEAYFETDEQKYIANYIVENYSVEQIRSELEDKDSTFFIAEIDGKATGFAKLRENSKPKCLGDENTIELHRIYILERFWRKGVGRILIEKSLSESKQKGYDSMWLGTWERNLRSHNFYKKLGFTKVGEYKFEYETEMITNFVYKKSCN